MRKTNSKTSKTNSKTSKTNSKTNSNAIAIYEREREIDRFGDLDLYLDLIMADIRTINL